MLLVSTMLFALLTVAFLNSIYIVKNYKHNCSSQMQYLLEKKSYLVTTIIYLALIVKIVLLPYFTYTINELSNIIPGAMCGAGVISANSYGEILIVLKIFIILSTMIWLTLNREDLESKNFKYFKKKIWLFLFIYLAILFEVVLEYLFFTNLSTVNPVSCCSTLYSNTPQNELPLNISIFKLVISFYVTYVLILISSYFKKNYLLASLSLLYLYLSYQVIVHFFSTYVYQLPTHKCPYCLLQSDYYYVGYIIYSSIIISTFYALSTLFFNRDVFKRSAISYTVATLFISLNFIIYLIINRTFL